MSENVPAGGIDPLLLEVLACPACDDRPPVKLTERGLICESCGRVYPIRHGWPQMLIENAEEAGPQD